MKRPKKVLIIPDMHVPFHNEKAVDLVFRMAKKVRFDVLITLGDLADFLEVSFHSRSLASRPGFASEIASVNTMLDRFDALKIPRKHFIAGNHEFRLDRYLAEKAPELADLPGMNTRELFRLKERGWHYTPYRSDMRLGKVFITHDEGNAGPLAAIKARETYQGSAVIGHCHAATSAYMGNAKNEVHGGFSFGWLGSAKDVDYLHQVKAKRWVHAVGTGLMENDGTVHLQCCPIIKGRIAVFGEVYK